VLRFGQPALNIARLASASASWIKDTVGTGYRPKGYILDQNDRPIFRYLIYGSMVSDSIRVLENRGGISRTVSIQNAPDDLYFRLAAGTTIEDIGNGIYLMDDKTYYLKIEDAGGNKAVIRDSDGKKELLIPIKNKLKYSILF
jgi:hypothetical protein